jgi:hypothetical protein
MIIQKLEVRRALSLTPGEREWLYVVSGGHVGIIQTLLILYFDKSISLSWQEDLAKVVEKNVVRDELTNVWKSLSDEEHFALKQF